MIKIAFVIDTIETDAGGTEKQLLLLLKNLNRKKFDPVLCVLRSSEWIDKNFNICPLYVIDIHSFRNFSSIYRFFCFVHFLKSQNFGIVHSFFKDGTRVGIVAGLLAQVRLNIAARRNQGYWMRGADLSITKFLNRWVDLMIANAENTKSLTVEKEGFPAERIAVIHNGIDLNAFEVLADSDPEKIRKTLLLPPEGPLVGIVANLRPVKDIGTFLHAARLVRMKIPKAEFLVVGEGDQKEEFLQLADHLGLNGSLHFLGRRHDVPEILRCLKVGVLSSKSESFSNTITEYVVSGLPVVCTDVGGAREAVEDGINGFVVPVGDAQAMADKILTILSNDLYSSMRKASLGKAPSFSLEIMVKKHEEIYSGGGQYVRTCNVGTG